MSGRGAIGYLTGRIDETLEIKAQQFFAGTWGGGIAKRVKEINGRYCAQAILDFLIDIQFAILILIIETGIGFIPKHKTIIDKFQARVRGLVIAAEGFVVAVEKIIARRQWQRRFSRSKIIVQFRRVFIIALIIVDIP